MEAVSEVMTEEPATTLSSLHALSAVTVVVVELVVESVVVMESVDSVAVPPHRRPAFYVEAHLPGKRGSLA